MLRFPFKLTLGVLLLCSASLVQAKLTVPVSADMLPDLSPEEQHYTVCSRTANYFLRSHYKAVKVDDAFADSVIERYLSYLDYNKSLYTQSEVDEIHKNRGRILDAITKCDLSYPYELYNDQLRRRFAKYSYFVDFVKKPVQADTKLTLEYERKDSPFFATEDEIRQMWTAEVTNEYINQVLSDKTDKAARDRLKRRYETALGRLVQINSEDAFSTFENSFASAIDPHTSYLSPDDSENFNDDINLSLEGIGAVLTSDDEFTVINELMPGSPAELSKKLKPKDKIVGVRQEDGSYDDIIGWRLTEVVKKIKGPKGTKVTLDIEREANGQVQSFQVELIRDKIRLQDREAKGEIKELDGNKIGVITIKSFYTDLHKDIKRELDKLLETGIKALVIDLRSNGGGLLPEAIMSTGLFIDEGPVVQVRDAVGMVLPQSDTDPSVAYQGPLVVLINRLSASSSEIMAAALRDYGRALIIGDTSFGKGTVQQNRPLSRVYDAPYTDKFGSIHYTIAKFYRITGGSTQLKGVTPDIFFPPQVDNEEIGERSEPYALPWDKIKPTIYKGYLNIDAYTPDLTLKHEARIKDNIAFNNMKSEMDRYLKRKAEKVLPVNLTERRAMKKSDDDLKLNNINARLKELGEKPIEKLSDLDVDFEFPDAMLEEACRIAADFSDAIAAQIYKAEDTPIFTRYSLADSQPADNSKLAPADPEAEKTKIGAN